ncbi:uncharacterized protein KZ484_025656 isoform 1-T1 [Pholidichthys leucotaenia]
MSSGKAAVISTSPPPYEALQPLPAQGYPPQEYPQQYGGAQYGQQTYPMAQPYLGQPGVVHVQPIMYVTQTHLSDPVDDYLWYSIFTMLCCLPLGIAALIYSILALVLGVLAVHSLPLTLAPVLIQTAKELAKDPRKRQAERDSLKEKEMAARKAHQQELKRRAVQRLTQLAAKRKKVLH